MKDFPDLESAAAVVRGAAWTLAEACKALMIAVLLAGLLPSGTPQAVAAGLRPGAGPQPGLDGAFAGVRVRLPLGEGARRVRYRLALAPVSRSEVTGDIRLRQGLELGFSRTAKPQLVLNGTPLAALPPPDEPARRKLGISTLGWIGIGAAVATLAYAACFFTELRSCEPHDDEC